MDQMRLLAIAILTILFIPYPLDAAETGTSDPNQPSIEWQGMQKLPYPNYSFYCDTDQDGYEEIFLYSGASLVVLDPPSYREVLQVESPMVNYSSFSPEIEVSIEDLENDGRNQIVIYSSDSQAHLANWTIYSGQDFKLLWKSPDMRIPYKGNSYYDSHRVIDLNADGTMEFISISNDSNLPDISARLRIYGGLDQITEWISPSFGNFPFFIIDNIDLDNALELVIMNGTGDDTWFFSSLLVFDGSSHELQWDLPQCDNIKFRLGPYKEAPNGYYYPQIQDINGNSPGRSVSDSCIRDITNDGIKDIIVEHQQYENDNVTDSGISVYSGLDGILEWNVTTTGAIVEFAFVTRALDILDADNDGQKELLVWTPNATSPLSNVSDIRLYSGVSGALKWNMSVAGDYFIVNTGDIDDDGNIEFLITNVIESNSEMSSRTFEIYDIKENRSLWKIGPMQAAGFSELFAEDINNDNKKEILFGNYTVTEIYDGPDFIENYICRTFQVINQQFEVEWTSPITVTESYLNRMELMTFEDNTSPLLIIPYHDNYNGKFTNSSVRIISTVDYKELGFFRFGDGSIYYHAEDIRNDARRELIVYFQPNRADSIYTNGTVFIFETRSFQKVWESSGFVNIKRYKLHGIDMTGCPERELLFERIYVVSFDPGQFFLDIRNNISIFNISQYEPIWWTESDNFDWIIDIRDFDKDNNVEIMVRTDSFPFRLVIIQFPRGTTWTNGSDWSKLDNPPRIISFSGPNTIPGGIPSQMKFNVEAVDPEGGTLSYRWMENDVLLGMEQNLTYTFPPGDHQVILSISDGYLTTYQTFKFKVDYPGTSPVMNIAPVVAIVAIGGFTAVFAFAVGTEAGKYRLAGLLFPLYTRLRKEEMLDHETRGLLRGFICAEPGVHYNEILRRLNLSNGTASYHLMALEREGFIKSRTCGRLKRFYPAGMKLINIPPKLGAVQEIILKTVQQKEGLSQREIARILEISHSNVNRQINNLVEKGFLRLVKDGVTTRCYLIEKKDNNGEGNKTENL